jgi:peptidyl-prolyl cis-trans isomerase C
MNVRLFAPALLVPLLLLAACSKKDAPEAAAAAPAEETVAVLNGKPISKSELDLYADYFARRYGRPVPEEQKAQLLDQYINVRLAADAAEKAGVQKQDKVAHQLTVSRADVLAEAGLQKYLDDNPVKDEELKPEYDARIAEMPREYHARHILVDDKAVADDITKRLQGGEDFGKLAKEKSKDPSAESGGDLGWFTLDTMVKPFSDAVAALQPGAITAAPVQSQFGWHVIRLEESRASTPPPFDEVKDRVKQFVQGKKVQAYLEELRKTAKIEKKI